MNREPGRTAAPGHSAACSIEHFASEELLPVIREVFPEEIASAPAFPAGREVRKYWEVAMSVRALRELGALRPDSRILGVGAGAEPTTFFLTKHAGEVVATDLYLGAGAWEGDARPAMLVAPGSCTRADFRPERLTVRHMDARVLQFPDESFDGIFSSSSIEHFGSDEEIAAAAYEMGRVLKPGGVLALTTELLVMGPSGAKGWPGCRLFAEADLRRLVVEASGLELVGDLDLGVSPATLEAPRNLAAVLEGWHAGRGLEMPHLVLVSEGQVFTSVQLALTKRATYPSSDNSWAAPTPTLRDAVRREAEATAARVLRALQAGRGTNCEPTDALPVGLSDDGSMPSLAEAWDAWDAVRARTALTAAATGPAWSRGLAFAKRTAQRLRDLGIIWDRERDLLRALMVRIDALERRLDEVSRRGTD
jgi:SAM-dependent methyltransferase